MLLYQKNKLTNLILQFEIEFNNLFNHVVTRFSFFYNITLDKLVLETDNALQQGYTIAWECDVSEKTFSSKFGVAVIPKKLDDQEKCLTYIVEENTITPEFRQQEFENYNTTDDHLMHITGTVKDQNGTTYYKVKNSWGTNPDRTINEGYVYFSEAYVMLKTISITLHKDVIPNGIAEKLKI